MFVINTDLMEQAIRPVDLMNKRQHIIQSKEHFNFLARPVTRDSTIYKSTKCLVLISIANITRSISFGLIGTNKLKTKWEPIPAVGILGPDKHTIGPFHTPTAHAVSYDIHYKYFKLECKELVGSVVLDALGLMFLDMYCEEVIDHV